MRNHDRNWWRPVRCFITLAGLVLASVAHAAGLLTPSDGSLPPLVVKSQNVNVVIQDGYAVTTVEQEFHNPHDRDLEALYSFPVPEHGAVGEFTLWIDGKPVTGEVLEKHEANRVYQEEKRAGRQAGIAEKDSFKTFEIRVAPVRAGKTTRTRLTYYQKAAVDTGIGRYVYPLEEGGVDEQKLAFWTANSTVAGTFSFDLRLRSSYPVEAVRVPGLSSAQVSQVGPSEWQIHIGNDSVGATDSERGGQAARAVQALEKDLVVYWRYRSGLPGVVDLVTYKPDSAKRGTFMLTLTPGDDLKRITDGRDWVFVLDISGSMQGKFATLAEGVQRALKKMNADDRFRIVLFNDYSRELTPGFINATPEAIAQYAAEVARIQPNNGTNLYAGIESGLNSLQADRTSAIILVTDGVANVGETEQRKFIELVKRKDIRLFTFIMGNSANRPLLETLTKASGGFAVSMSNSDDIVGQLLSATAKVSHEALHGVGIKISGIKTADITPKEIGSLYRGQQLVILGHYWGSGNAEVELSGRVSGQGKTYRTQFQFPAKSESNPELERLWAYAAVQDIQDEMEKFGQKPDLKQAATDIALEHGLVTDYTSMVVLQTEQFDARGIARRNQGRVAIEQAAQIQRAQSAPVSRRADGAQPMFNGTQPSHSGAGSIDVLTMLCLLLTAWVVIRQRRAA